MTVPRVAVVSDLREERWYAMDLVAEMLLINLRASEANVVEATPVCPEMTRRLTRLPVVGTTAAATTADRIWNRVWDYPRRLRARATDFDLFHVIDHSYAHLVTWLPPGRALVTCHDLDAFRSVLAEAGGSIVERALGRRLLEGMRAARKILAVSAATRNELVATGVASPDQVVIVPNGVHPACSPRSDPVADREAAALLGPISGDAVELLHVGSTIPRKRLDVLLRAVAALRQISPRVRLVQVGGSLTASQRGLAERLELNDHVVVLPFVAPRVLASVYRRATLLLQTSDREGFGLPVAEALSCGTPVVASDLPALREVGGPATTFCRVGDVESWRAAVLALLEERTTWPERRRRRRADGLDWARRFDWRAHARATVEVYRELFSSATAAHADSESRRAS